jgi:trigger factor
MEALGPCQVSLDIDVEAPVVAQAIDQAYREFSRHVVVPGFRRGHAPLSFVKQRVPAAQLRERTAEILVEPAYQAALAETATVPYAAPKLELTSLEITPGEQQFKFKAIVPLAPKVELGQYKGLVAKRPSLEITEEDVDREVDERRERIADYDPITDRPTQLGDTVRVELTVHPSGEPSPRPMQPLTIDIGDENNLKGIDAELVGMNVGDEKTFRFTYPDDYNEGDLAGKDTEFKVVTRYAYHKTLPDLDDSLAEKLHAGTTLPELRAKVREDLETRAQELALDTVQSQLVDAAVANSTTNFPPFLLESEVDSDVRSFVQSIEQRGGTLEDYLERAGRDRESLMREFEHRADIRIRRGLVLGEIARTESLLLTDEDLQQEFERLAKQNKTTIEAIHAYVDANKDLDRIRNTAQTKKILDFLVSTAIIREEEVKQADAEPAETVADQDSEDK